MLLCSQSCDIRPIMPMACMTSALRCEAWAKALRWLPASDALFDGPCVPRFVRNVRAMRMIEPTIATTPISGWKRKQMPM
ncbi:hypothetical protein D3C87_1674520 [compost metagenome]